MPDGSSRYKNDFIENYFNIFTKNGFKLIRKNYETGKDDLIGMAERRVSLNFFERFLSHPNGLV